MRRLAPKRSQKREARGLGRRAFTLIELMITIAIVAIVMGLGVPTIVRMFHKEALRQATTDILEVAANARAMAILHGEMTELVINVEGRSLSVGGGGGEGKGSGPVRDRNSAQWSDLVKLEALGINTLDCTEQPQVSVRFFPNGTCDELTMVLCNDRGEYRMLSWEVTTGLASVETDPQHFLGR